TGDRVLQRPALSRRQRLAAGAARQGGGRSIEAGVGRIARCAPLSSPIAGTLSRRAELHAWQGALPALVCRVQWRQGPCDCGRAAHDERSAPDGEVLPWRSRAAVYRAARPFLGREPPERLGVPSTGSRTGLLPGRHTLG